MTQIRPHRFKETKTCKRIIGYDAKVLYPSTMMQEIPCGKDKVVRYETPRDEAARFVDRLKAGTWFGFAEVDIKIPRKLWMKFEEMPPFFFTRQIPDEEVPQHMKAYMKRTGRKRGDGKKRVGGLSARKRGEGKKLVGGLSAAAVCPSAAVICESWRGNHGGVSNHRLPGDKSAEVVRR